MNVPLSTSTTTDPQSSIITSSIPLPDAICNHTVQDQLQLTTTNDTYVDNTLKAYVSIIQKLKQNVN